MAEATSGVSLSGPLRVGRVASQTETPPSTSTVLPSLALGAQQGPRRARSLAHGPGVERPQRNGAEGGCPRVA